MLRRLWKVRWEVLPAHCDGKGVSFCYPSALVVLDWEGSIQSILRCVSKETERAAGVRYSPGFCVHVWKAHCNPKELPCGKNRLVMSVDVELCLKQMQIGLNSGVLSLPCKWQTQWVWCNWGTCQVTATQKKQENPRARGWDGGLHLFLLPLS